MAIKIPSRYETTVLIDGERVPVYVARLSIDQAGAFKSEFLRIQTVGQRSTLARAAAHTDEAFDVVMDRQLEDELRAKRFLAQAITDYVSIAPGHVFENDSDTVTSGADLVRVFGGRDDVLGQLLMAIHVENHYGADVKKALTAALESPGPASEAIAPAAAL